MVTIAELAVLAGGHAGIAEHLNENPKAFENFLEGITSPIEVEDFIQYYLGGHTYENGERVYLGGYHYLYLESIKRKKFLSDLRKTEYPEGFLKDIEKKFYFVNGIETYGYKHTPPSGMEDAKPPDEEHF